jgi:hypothetical protein
VKPAFARHDKVTHTGKRGRVEGFDDVTGMFTITFANGHVTAALGVDLELAEAFKPRAPKPAARA